MNDANGTPETQTIVCEEALDIAIAAGLRDSLLQALQAQLPVVLQADAVSRADTAALQVLTAFLQDARSQGLAVRWETPSEPLRRAARLLGLSDALELRDTAT